MSFRTVTGAKRTDGTQLKVTVPESALPQDRDSLVKRIGGKDDADRAENEYQLMLGSFFSSASSGVRNWLGTDEAQGMDEAGRTAKATALISEYVYERRQAQPKKITLSTRSAYSKAAVSALENDGYIVVFADEQSNGDGEEATA